MASAGMAMYQGGIGNPRLSLRLDQGDQPHHCIILLVLQYSCAQCECCCLQGDGTDRQSRWHPQAMPPPPPPPSNAAIGGELLERGGLYDVVQLGCSIECKTSHSLVGHFVQVHGMAWLRTGARLWNFRISISHKRAHLPQVRRCV
jgi:hypothetical protein